MENQKLPNATIALVLAIISFIGCCFWGLGGIILAGIALYLTNRDKALYQQNPELYDNYGQVKTARILAIISLVLSALTLISMIVTLVSLGGIEAYFDMIEEMQREYARQAS